VAITPRDPRTPQEDRGKRGGRRFESSPRANHLFVQLKTARRRYISLAIKLYLPRPSLHAIYQAMHQAHTHDKRKTRNFTFFSVLPVPYPDVSVPEQVTPTSPTPSRQPRWRIAHPIPARVVPCAANVSTRADG